MPPNVLFIVCDDLNDAITGMGGHPQAKTPCLDRLMAEGVRFLNGEVNVPICGPSRASFLSGLAPWTTGYYGYNFCRDPWWNNPTLGDAATFMEHFAANGYAVYGTGKIFHNHQEKNEVWTHGHGHPVDWGPWSWDGQHPGAGWQSCASHHSLPADWGAEMLFASLADLPQIPPDPETGAPGYAGWRKGDGTAFRYESEEDRDLMPDELNAQWAAEVLAREYDDPFLLCVGMNRTHAPLVAPQPFFDLFPLGEVELAVTLENDVEDCAKIFREGHTCTGDWGFKKFAMHLEAGGVEMLRRWTQAYLANVAFVDAQIGVVLDALRASAHADDTIVVFTSDNGYHMGEKDYLFKNSCWEEANRVPFIWAGPGIARGRSCDAPVSLLDIFPTLNDRCGLPPDPHADRCNLPLDGHSLAPLLADPEHGTWDGPAVALSVIGSDTPLDAGAPGAVADQHWSVRSRTHRYLLYSNGEEELYDHVADPYEWHNRATDPALAPVKAELREHLRTIAGR